MKVGKLPTLKLTGPQAPEDAKRIADWLEPQLRQVQILSQALQKFGSLGENFNNDLRQRIPFRQNEELEVSVNVRVGIAGVFVVDSEVTTQPLPTFAVRRITNTRIGLRPTWDTNPGGFKWITFYVLGI